MSPGGAVAVDSVVTAVWIVSAIIVVVADIAVESKMQWNDSGLR